MKTEREVLNRAMGIDAKDTETINARVKWEFPFTSFEDYFKGAMDSYPFSRRVRAAKVKARKRKLQSRGWPRINTILITLSLAEP